MKFHIIFLLDIFYKIFLGISTEMPTWQKNLCRFMLPAKSLSHFLVLLQCEHTIKRAPDFDYKLSIYPAKSKGVDESYCYQLRDDMQ